MKRYGIVILLVGFISGCGLLDGPERHSVSISVSPPGAAIISPSTDSIYNDRERIRIEAHPGESYRFLNWSGDVDTSANPLQLELVRDLNLTANLVKKSYQLSIQKTGKGTVSETVVAADSDYDHGTTVELEALPEEGWAFVEWGGEIQTTENPVQITIKEETDVEVLFERTTRFSNRKSIGGLERVVSAASGDFDGDGDMDVAAVSESGKIVWFENTGQEQFGPPVVLVNRLDPGVEDSQFFSVVAADLNKDGLTDIVSTAHGNGVYWFQATGSGFITRELCCQNGFDLDIGDLTGNSYPDILVSTQSDSLVYYANKCDCIFEGPRLVDDGIGAASTASLADFDQNGSLDVLSGESNFMQGIDAPSRLAWYSNGGNGTFGQEQIIDNETSHYRFTHAADVTGDGLPDPIALITSPNEYFYYENQGSGSFAPRQKLTSGTSTIALADLDNDGKVELIRAIDSLYWYEINGTWEQEFEQGIDESLEGFGVRDQIATADIDGDGDVDLLIPYGNGNEVIWYENLLIDH